MARHDNVAAFKNGFLDIQTILYEQQFKMMKEIAMNLLHDAIEVWDIENSYNNMTGNTRYSFISGVFYQGSLKEYYTPWDVAEGTGDGGGNGPTTGYSFPGDTIWFYSGNKTLYDIEGRNDEYGDVEVKSTVLRYNSPFKFQKATKGGSGPRDATDLMNSLAKEANKKGWDVMVAVGVPYADYLLNTRKLHVLQDTVSASKQIADSAIGGIPKL